MPSLFESAVSRVNFCAPREVFTCVRRAPGSSVDTYLAWVPREDQGPDLVTLTIQSVAEQVSQLRFTAGVYV